MFPRSSIDPWDSPGRHSTASNVKLNQCFLREHAKQYKFADLSKLNSA